MCASPTHYFSQPHSKFTLRCTSRLETWHARTHTHKFLSLSFTMLKKSLFCLHCVYDVPVWLLFGEKPHMSYESVFVVFITCWVKENLKGYDCYAEDERGKGFAVVTPVWVGVWGLFEPFSFLLMLICLEFCTCYLVSGLLF